MPAGPEGKGNDMIVLQKMNGERFVLNHNQIENIIHKITEYNAKVQDIRREISINDFRV